MSNQEQPKIEELEPKPETLDIKHLSRLFFLSYKFSQGNGIDQKYIFEYLKSKHPNWKITKEIEEAMIYDLTKSVEQLTGSNKFHKDRSGERDTQPSLDSELMRLSQIFEREPEMKNLIRILTDSVIGGDYKYLVSKGGRPRSESHGSTPATDPFLSHLIYYGFLGHKTGAEEYDDMFREITEYIKAGNLHDEDLSRFKEIIFVWNEKHPDQKVDLEKELGAGV